MYPTSRESAFLLAEPLEWDVVWGEARYTVVQACSLLCVRIFPARFALLCAICVLAFFFGCHALFVVVVVVVASIPNGYSPCYGQLQCEFRTLNIDQSFLFAGTDLCRRVSNAQRVVFVV